MFLQTKQILGLETEAAIRDRLGKLPPTLEAAYDEIYAKIKARNKHDRALTERAFKWVMGTYEPLSSEQLLAAIRVDPESEVFELSPEISESQLLHLCNNLLLLDSQRQTWRVSHLSVVEYFEHNHWTLLQANCHGGRTCLRFLMDAYGPHRNESEIYGIFHPDHPFHEYARHHWLSHIQAQEGEPPDPVLVSLLKAFLGSFDESSIQYRQWHRQVRDVDLRKPGPRGQLYPIMMTEISPENASILAVCRLSIYTLLADWWTESEFDVSRRTEFNVNLLALAAAGGSKPICEELLKRGVQVDLQLLDDLYGSALGAAAQWGRTDVVEFLVERGAQVNLPLQAGEYGSALAAAANHGQTGVVELLIEQGADVNMQLQGGEYGSALAAAAYFGQMEVVELLIEQGADVNMQLQGGEYGSALAAAASWGSMEDMEVVELLIEQGADVNMQLRGVFGSALAAAAYCVQTGVVELLIEQGADVNMQLQGGLYGSALAAAAAHLKRTNVVKVLEVVEVVEIVELLIEQGADVNMQLQGGEYGSALAAAAHGGQTEIVELLIEQGADVNMQLRGAYGSALEAAVSSGRIEIVKFLLAQGAEVNLPLRGGRYEARCQCLRGGCNDGVTNLVLVHATLGTD